MPSKLKLSPSQLTRAFARGLSADVGQYIQRSQSAAAVDRSLDHLSWSRRYLPNYFRAAPSAMHVWMADRLHAARKQRGVKLNIVGPRGGAKSTVGNTSYGLRCAVEGTEPYILLLGKTETMAAKQLSHIKRQIEENPLIARDYPEAAGRGSIWSESLIRLRNGVQIQAFGAGQSIRGARNDSERPTLVIGDDIQEDDAITSKLIRDRDWTWLTGAVLKIGTPNHTNFINLCTAIHREAIGSRLETMPGWVSKSFASIIEWPANMGLWERWAEVLRQHDDPNAERNARDFYEANRTAMDEGAVVLWPEWESLYELMLMRETEGRNAFEREKQSRLASVEENEWPDEYFDDHIWFEDWPIGWRIKTLALDPSKGKDAKRGDYSAYVSLMVGTDGTLYVDADLARRPTPQMISDGIAICQDWQPDAFGVEANAWQDLLANDFAEEFVRAGMINAAPYTIDNRIKKPVRIRKLGPYLAQHRLKFKRKSPGARLVVSQLRDFPDPHSHDDGPDALEMALRLAIETLGGEFAAQHPLRIEH
ncbi:MAG: hypothetical protein JNL96_15055 [Planctomycetaceae bacterium]|nr:hypothetical protein [Planctomycetaceae bacterium]